MDAAQFDYEMSEENWVHENEPYNSQTMWGGNDNMAIMAMYMGDPAAEVYCIEKMQDLGGWPWNKGVAVHSSYYPEKPAAMAPIPLELLVIASVLVSAICFCVAIIS